jgi:ribosomal protein S18 acetylase RimI-like enzyme
MKLKFRKAEEKDINLIFDFVKLAIADLDSDDIPQWDEIYPSKNEFINNFKRDELYVGLLDEKPVITFALSKEDEGYESGNWKYSDDSFIVIHRLIVNPKYKNQGIATKALLESFKIAREKGYKSMRLDVFTKNPKPQHLYRKMGFKDVGFVDYRKGRFILMEKNLLDEPVKFEKIFGDDEKSVCELSKIATEIVKDYYDSLLGAEQNDYMLEKFQSVPAIHNQIDNGYNYFFAIKEDKKLGFFAFYKRDDALYLSKLYLYKDERGKAIQKRF